MGLQSKKCVIHQREIGQDTKSVANALKSALREDPDVILVGEIRDKETLLSAIEAAETGHLVFSTLHTNGTISSINRLKGFIKEDMQEPFMRRLANCIRGVVHQQLVPTTKNGLLTPAVEILTFTPTVIDYIKQGKTHDVLLLMQRSKQPNIVTMNMSLFDLYQKGMITKETALEYSLEKVEMDQFIRGMYRDSIAEESIL